MPRGSPRMRSLDAVSGLPPGGPAGGDLSGLYPNPTVVQIQGQPVAAGTVDGQILIFDLPTTSWVPSAGVILPDNPAGAMVMTFAAGVTSVSFGQTQDASAAGAVFSIRAQRGFAGFIGGELILGGGDGGTAGVNLGGPTVIEQGTVVGQTTAKLSFRTANTEFGFIHAGAGANMRIQNVAGGVANSGIQIIAANALYLNGSTTVQLESTSNQFFFSTGNRIVDWYGASVLARSDTYHATGATTFVYAAGTTSIAETQTAAAAAGAAWSRTAQAAGGANNNGGVLQFRGGARTGTGLRGGVRLGLNGTTETLVEIAEVAAGQRVVALARNANITTVEMIANSGDLVTYFGDAATAPTAGPVSGFTVYGEAGAAKVITTANTITTFGFA